MAGEHIVQVGERSPRAAQIALIGADLLKNIGVDASVAIGLVDRLAEQELAKPEGDK